jgi:hypothetical protein
MSGHLNGVRAQLRAMEPKSGYVNFVCHSLDLALRETARDVPMIRDSLSLVKNCTVVFRESAKRKQKLQQLADDIVRSIVRLIFKKAPASGGGNIVPRPAPCSPNFKTLPRPLVTHRHTVMVGNKLNASTN